MLDNGLTVTASTVTIRGSVPGAGEARCMVTRMMEFIPPIVRHRPTANYCFRLRAFSPNSPDQPTPKVITLDK